MLERKLEIEVTADGSPTLYIPEMDEHYHSVKGAKTESCHIFRDCGLLHNSKMKLRVLEIGFGTGLNALVTAMCSDREVEYFTLELYPLSAEILASTKYATNPDEDIIHDKIKNAKWEKGEEINSHFIIHKLMMDFTLSDNELPQNIDVVYFDAFAPEKQPEMWSEDCFKRIFQCMNSGGILTTYCAKGEIRRRLQSIGFNVERIPGPPCGKREILRATKP